MITIQKVENKRTVGGEEAINVELRGLSTDSKPTEMNDKIIDNGSVYVEIDTGKVFLYDLENEQWKEM